MKKKIMVAVLAALLCTGCKMPEISFENANSPLFVQDSKADSVDASAAEKDAKDTSGKTAADSSSAVTPAPTTPVKDTSDATESAKEPKDTSVADNQKKDDSSALTDSSEVTDSKADKKDTDSKSEKTEITGKPAIVVEDPQQLTVKNTCFYQYGKGNKSAYARYEWLRLDENAEELCPELGKALQNEESLVRKDMKAAFDELDAASQKATGKSSSRYSINRKAYPVRCDNAALSALFITHDDRGTKSDMSFETINLDSQTGETIALSDIVDLKELPKELTDSYETVYPDDPITDFKKMVTDLAEDDYVWALSREGVNCYFADDSGEQLITVPVIRNGSKDLFSDSYKEVPESYIMPLSEEFPSVFDKSDDGKADTFYLYGNDKGDRITVELNGEKAVGRFIFNGFMPYLVRTADEGYYIYVLCSLDNDYEQIAVYDICEETPVFLGVVSNTGFMWDNSEDDVSMRILPGAPEEFYLSTDINLLSTYSGVRPYKTGSDGMPEPLDDWYLVHGDIELTVLTPFVADVINEKTGRVKEEGVDIEEGTKLKIFRTDAKSIVDLKTEDDEIIRIEVDTVSGGWPQTIDGTRIEKLFDGIRFAG